MAEARQATRSKQLGSMAELFGDPRWRRNTIVGMLLAFAGVVGLWGIGFFSFDLFSPVFDKTSARKGLSASVIAGKMTLWTGITSLLQNARRVLRHLCLHPCHRQDRPQAGLRHLVRRRDGRRPPSRSGTSTTSATSSG